MTAILQDKVLVLNRLWQAVNLCTVERAMSLLYTQHAQVVHEDQGGEFFNFSFNEWNSYNQTYTGNDVIHSVRLKIRAPKIILLQTFDKFPKKDVKFTRQNIFERDQHTCQYCCKRFERKDLNLDHVIPRYRGGETSWVNVVCSCIPCNSRKGNRSPEEAGMRLLNQPKKPRWRPLIEIKAAHLAPQSWRHFVQISPLEACSPGSDSALPEMAI